MQCDTQKKCPSEYMCIDGRCESLENILDDDLDSYDTREQFSQVVDDLEQEMNMAQDEREIFSNSFNLSLDPAQVEHDLEREMDMLRYTRGEADVDDISEEQQDLMENIEQNVFLDSFDTSPSKAEDDIRREMESLQYTRQEDITDEELKAVDEINEALRNDIALKRNKIFTRVNKVLHEIDKKKSNLPLPGNNPKLLTLKITIENILYNLTLFYTIARDLQCEILQHRWFLIFSKDKSYLTRKFQELRNQIPIQWQQREWFQKKLTPQEFLIALQVEIDSMSKKSNKLISKYNKKIQERRRRVEADQAIRPSRYDTRRRSITSRRKASVRTDNNAPRRAFHSSTRRRPQSRATAPRRSIRTAKEFRSTPRKGSGIRTADPVLREYDELERRANELNDEAKRLAEKYNIKPRK